MNLHQHRPPIVGQSLDDPALPKRAFAVKAPFHNVCGEPEQRLIVAWVWQRSPVDVMRRIEIRILYPFRRL
jgi:hypothetical protein